MTNKIDYPLDTIGDWSEDKLTILREYAKEYSKILTSQKKNYNFTHIYIDAFAGGGTHESKEGGKHIKGSPINALEIEPPFDEYFFIEKDPRKAAKLRKLVVNRSDAQVLEGDCNKRLLNDVFPHVRFEDYKRALCFLDPYNIGLDWDVIETAGKMRSIEIVLNFSIMDINRNLKREPKKPLEKHDIDRMNRCWGDESWRNSLYEKTPGLFGEMTERIEGNIRITCDFQHRLIKKAGFKFVPDPIPMCNTIGLVVYYLFFASQNETGNRIMKAIFKKYMKEGL